MSDGGDKPFAPTDHRLQEARRRGEVPQARELPSAAGLLAVVLVAWLMGLWSWRRLQALFDTALQLVAQPEPLQQQATLALALAAQCLFWVTLPLLAVAALVPLLVRRIVNGPVFSWQPVVPDFKRLNPGNGLKRLVSLETTVGLAKGLAGMAVLLLALFSWTAASLPALLQPWPAAAAIAATLRALRTEALIAAALLLVLALADTLYQRWSFHRRMRMDMKDLRDEHKQLEGDPHVKAARRGEHQRLSRG